jgi:hypothetical protein
MVLIGQKKVNASPIMSISTSMVSVVDISLLNAQSIHQCVENRHEAVITLEPPFFGGHL